MNHKNIYYQSLLVQKDKELVEQIKQVHKSHPAYGYIRVALELGINKKRSQRVMRKYNVRPPRRRVRRFSTTQSVAHTSYTNILRGMEVSRPYQALCSDLTYIKFQGKFVYLGTVQDIFTRQILSANISDKHDSLLALSIVQEALEKTKGYTHVFHSDEGNEYMAQLVTDYVESQGVKVSVSDKGSPWQNGFKESFFSRFKEENGDLNRFETLGEFEEEVYSYVRYYNTYRIHTKLKMSPVQFKLNFVENVLEGMGC